MADRDAGVVGEGITGENTGGTARQPALTSHRSSSARTHTSHSASGAAAGAAGAGSTAGAGAGAGMQHTSVSGTSEALVALPSDRGVVAKFGITGTPEEVAAANRIIGLYRMHAARRRIRDMLRGVVAKYFDDHSGYYYYYNEATGETAWTKPKLLGSEDIVAHGEEEVKTEDLAPDGTRPRKGEILCIPNNTQEQLAAATALFQGMVRLIQIRCRNLERPYRTVVAVDKGDAPDIEQHLRIIVFDRPAPNMTQYIVKHAEKPQRCGILTEYARVKPVSEYLTYDDWGEFWASYAPLPGMTLYYVRYTHSPYRCLVTQDASVGAIWRPHFSFFGYEAAKFSVRCSPDGMRYAVALPGLMEDWPLCFEFVAFTQFMPGTSKINVLERHDPELRFKICAGKTAIRAGWKLQFSFFALDVPVPGTVKFSVQQNRQPFDQCRIWRHMPMAPWLHNMYFYGFNP